MDSEFFEVNTSWFVDSCEDLNGFAANIVRHFDTCMFRLDFLESFLIVYP